VHAYVHPNVFVYFKELFVVRHRQEISVYLTLKLRKYCNESFVRDLFPLLPPTRNFLKLKRNDIDYEINLREFLHGLKEGIFYSRTVSTNQTDSWYVQRSAQIKPAGLHFRQLNSQESTKGSTDVCE
jgi:hypothetical protein